MYILRLRDNTPEIGRRLSEALADIRMGRVYTTKVEWLVDQIGMAEIHDREGAVGMDRLEDAQEKDHVCVGSQSILRLYDKLRKYTAAYLEVGPSESHNRLTALCDDLHQIIKQARPCGHSEHLAHVPSSDGAVDRLIEAINAVFMDGVIERRPILSPRR